MKNLIHIIIILFIFLLLLLITLPLKVLSVIYYWGNPPGIEGGVLEEYSKDIIDLTNSITGYIDGI